METSVKKSNGNLFRTFVKGQNFMTPDLIGYYEIKNGEVELTEGKYCYSMDEAMEYIETLNK